MAIVEVIVRDQWHSVMTKWEFPEHKLDKNWPVVTDLMATKIIKDQWKHKNKLLNTIIKNLIKFNRENNTPFAVVAYFN
jgi:hypothetical protein